MKSLILSCCVSAICIFGVSVYVVGDLAPADFFNSFDLKLGRLVVAQAPVVPEFIVENDHIFVTLPEHTGVIVRVRNEQGGVIEEIPIPTPGAGQVGLGPIPYAPGTKLFFEFIPGWTTPNGFEPDPFYGGGLIYIPYTVGQDFVDDDF